MDLNAWMAATVDWFAAMPGGDMSEASMQEWKRFSGNALPVVTIFGVYDTGKSALLRRLLVDEGVPVPPWLTISAKPETEKVAEVVALGCLIRDTPGVTTASDSLRGGLHTRDSLAAAGLTDVLLMLLPPQLVTESGYLRDITALNWPRGALIVAVGRFDEAAGTLPEDDPHGYRELRARKERELRTSVSLDPGVAVHFVCQDPFQVAGPVADPDPSVWDEYRAWDGMAGLAETLRSIGRAGSERFRDAAQLRYWHGQLTESRDELMSQLGLHWEAVALATEVKRRRESWLGQVEALDEAAQSALQRELQDAVRAVLATQAPSAENVKPQLEAALELWWRRQVSAMRRVRRDVRAGMDREYERPGWDFLDSVAFQIREPDQPTDSSGDSEMKAKLRSIPTNLLTATRNYLTTANQTTSEFAASQRTPSQGLTPPKKRATAKVAGKEVDLDAALDAAPAALDAVLDIKSMVSNWWKEKAADKARLERLAQVEKEADRLAQLVAREALPMWDQVVADTKLEIETSTHEAIETGEALEHTIEQIEAAVRKADDLLERLPGAELTEPQGVSSGWGSPS